ncbi:hypothetical protein Ddye_011970 [Dipteronia dyeriana]|uniref:Transposase MuDR plant domain-containing protein n=1 Tax=Dipteronia dyeriana TaxID=168575 RepID=A0AAD9X3E9_9ROSI|nr:hypothetical protein Ddye_011970 [Dipteronia dyeriana]
MLNYDGDSEKDDDKDDEEGEIGEREGMQDNYGQVPIVDNYVTDGNDEIIKECIDLFEGYQSKYDNEYFSNSNHELEMVKISKLMKGQTFDNAIQMREIFREYAIQRGVVLKREKKDNVRLTCTRLGDGCPWRAHGSCLIDRILFMIKTLVDEHECHRVYNNKEVKAKWIAYRFENLMKSNPSVSVKVIGDLLRDNYKVSVSIQRIYKGFRPFIGVDGCHLKRPFIGVLLFAMALDANSGLLPLAVCICEKGEHYKKLFWRVMKSFKVFDFNEAMDEIGVINPAAQSWLQKIDTEHWFRFAYDQIISQAMAAISHYCGKSILKGKVSEFDHNNLTKSAYLQTYRDMIHPIPDQKRWPEVPVCLLIED